MRIRALVLDDDRMIRGLLWHALDSRGCEVITFPDPGSCPLHLAATCPCPAAEACADLIISDVQMPNANGLDFVEAQKAKGCRCQHIALMSGGWTDAERRRARELGCKVFAKPFHLGDIYAWLDEVAEGLDPTRKLSDWFQPDALPSEPPAVRLESSRGVRQDNGVSKARDRWLTV